MCVAVVREEMIWGNECYGGVGVAAAKEQECYDLEDTFDIPVPGGRDCRTVVENEGCDERVRGVGQAEEEAGICCATHPNIVSVYRGSRVLLLEVVVEC